MDIIAITQLDRRLTSTEESGHYAPSATRQHMPPVADTKPGPASVRFVWPVDRRHHPLPPRYFA